MMPAVRLHDILTLSVGHVCIWHHGTPITVGHGLRELAQVLYKVYSDEVGLRLAGFRRLALAHLQFSYISDGRLQMVHVVTSTIFQNLACVEAQW